MRQLVDLVRIAGIVRREATAVLKLGPWMLLSVLCVLALWRADLIATSGMFQSPGETPSPTPTLPATATALPPATATVEAATPFPTATIAPAVTATATEIPLATATSTVPPSVTAVVTTVTATPSGTPPVPTLEPTSGTPTASATPTPDRDRYAEGESDLRFDFGMLFDSMALGLTYVWMCCGVLVLLSIPALFLVLWVVSRRRQQEAD